MLRWSAIGPHVFALTPERATSILRVDRLQTCVTTLMYYKAEKGHKKRVYIHKRFLLKRERASAKERYVQIFSPSHNATATERKQRKETANRYVGVLLFIHNIDLFYFKEKKNLLFLILFFFLFSMHVLLSQ